MEAFAHFVQDCYDDVEFNIIPGGTIKTTLDVITGWVNSDESARGDPTRYRHQIILAICYNDLVNPKEKKDAEEPVEKEEPVEAKATILENPEANEGDGEPELIQRPTWCDPL